MNLGLEEAESISTPVQAQLSKLGDIDLYVKAGRPEDAFAIMGEVERQMTPPFDKIVPLGYVLIHTELGNADEAQKALAGFEEYITAFKLEMMRPRFYRQQGRIEELRGQYDRAILSYEKQHELAPADRNVYGDVGRCYRHLEEYVKAEENLLEKLKVIPFDPETNFELALVYDATGKRPKALEYLEKALEMWKDADEGFEPAVEARDTMARWKSTDP